MDVLYHFRNKWPLFKGAGSSTLIITGMEQYFQSLKRPGPWYREFLAAQLRKGMLSPQFEQDYLSVHVRLGDFARPATDTNKLVQNNVGTPLEWYAEIIRFVKAANLNLAIVLSSDGSDDELAPLLRIPGVERTTARNALDELFIMSRSRGIVGSRSTFSSWGAFLGATPLLLIEGGNAYPPHADVWEDTSDRERKAWLTAVLTGSQSTKTRS
ncbi:hypothetical protein LR392_14970 [Arthrobacter sp. AK04]|uniref:hypothetical protein n=1 Tax=Arthrobacter sp. AK04 TaxID=2900048 RepID=UPI001E49FE1B|nr:hypothetical protein [Arthrobacter sp. AK04]MCD5343525.1 hypothetical protein [Arthrobacter sp. AK04]